jgi:hypothetical protein
MYYYIGAQDSILNVLGNTFEADLSSTSLHTLRGALQLILDNKIIDAFIPGQKYFIFSFNPGQKIATIAEFCFY